MGFPILEILRQGVWASLTGGWFYDPHQNIFCNTVHLYIWLFLLCTPFSVYLYYPPSVSGWALYCASIALLFSFLKLLNHGLHYIYDTTECIIVPMDNEPPSEQRSEPKKTRTDEGMELQMMGVATLSIGKDQSDNESVTSLEYHKPTTSTIDLKVDVHRKNSSESSAEDSSQSNKQMQGSVATNKSDLCAHADDNNSQNSNTSSRSRPRTSHRHKSWVKQSRNSDRIKIDEIRTEKSIKYSKNEDSVAVNIDYDDVNRNQHTSKHKNKDFYREWMLDPNENAPNPYFSKLNRRLSTESRDNSEPSVSSPPKKKNVTKRRHLNYSESMNMRRNSNATMSTIQLPLVNSTAQLVLQARRSSNVADNFLPTGSVELGAYMLRDGMRRIRSAALDRPLPSAADLAPQPVSAETVANARNPALPPPSKSLVRNPQMYLCPYDYGSEIVYPIAEISDEPRGGSASPDSYSDYSGPTFRGFDWDTQAAQSDEEYEENGSGSPLINRNKTRIVSSEKADESYEKQSRSSSSKKKNKLANEDSLVINEKEDRCSNIMVKRDSDVSTKKVIIPRLSEQSCSAISIIEPVAGCSKDSQEYKEEYVETILEDDTHSLYGLSQLFEEIPFIESLLETSFGAKQESISKSICDKPTEPCANSQKSVSKQSKNSKSRTSSQKENKKLDKHCKKDEAISMDTVEAQAALVQGLECLFAATNANTVVMPPHRQSSERRRENSGKTRKRSIEEVAQTSTSTILPTSMPLLAAFLNSRPDHPTPPALPSDPNTNTEEMKSTEDEARFRPLMDRNHRNRIRKIKRSTRQKKRTGQVPQEMSFDDKNHPNDSMNLHLATSFDDTTDGAIHYFMDDQGKWMLYTFDKSGSRVSPEPVYVDMERNRKNPSENTQEPTNSVGSCGSLASEVNNSCEMRIKRRGNSLDQSLRNGSTCNSSNQGSNNPLLSSSNNLSSTAPASATSENKRLYVFDGATGVAEPRSPVAYVTDSLLEQIEAERQSRMCFPSMHINYLMNRNRSMEPENSAPSILQFTVPGSIGDNSLDMNVSRHKFNLIDSMDNTSQNQPKSYYKFKLFKCWEVKTSMDRLKLMALFDRNLTFIETFISIFLAVCVAVLGSVVLNTGYYKDIYAFWFCFIMAGSQYSLLKSVQPDSASPVHGFNRVVVFSRPIYFCLCSFLLYILNTEFNAIEKSTYSDKIYGLVYDEKYFLYIGECIMSQFLMFLPVTFSLGLFPQINTFLMYLFEQIDMYIFGGNASCSLSASIYCIFRSVCAIGLLYGFAYSGLIEEKKSQHILFSIFCGLLVPIAYHLSRSGSDYSHIWNLIKKHLIPPELYTVQIPETELNRDRNIQDRTSEKSTKNNNSESNISKQNSIGSSSSKINFSSDTNILKRSQTSSASSLKYDPKNDNTNSSGSIKVDIQPNCGNEQKILEETMEDPLPKKLQETVNMRLKNDVIVCTFLAIFVFGIHCTTVFTTLQKELVIVVWCIAIITGWVVHYLIPTLRKQQPWLILSRPVFKQQKHEEDDCYEPFRIMWFEKVYVYLCFLERNLIYPVIFLTAVTQDAPKIIDKFGLPFGTLIVCVCALKCLRNSYSQPDSQYLILIFSILLFTFDFQASETFLIDYFVMAVLYSKIVELLLKLEFVVTYIAPWQITWGSAFHALAQPFSVPHSAMLFCQLIISSLLSTPLNPLLGSAIFLISYVRPVKFWERDYNTKRVDQSNTRLSSQLDRNLGADDNNLNSIFYEHLTRSLQHYLYGDLALGRWGPVQQGDCFVLASDSLNCLVHLVEMGNGLVSFQVRGLEFGGTYCQQREVEAISETPEADHSCCCCIPGHELKVLTFDSMFSLRWLAWRLVSTSYVLEGYSISDNNALSMFQSYQFRKILITLYVKSIIYYTVCSDKLEDWLASPPLLEALRVLNVRSFVDLDPIFNSNLDEDYDFRSSGITRDSFSAVYQEWIRYCLSRRTDVSRIWNRETGLVTLCYALSLVGRRALGAASHNSVASVDFFLYGLHSLFKGDFRITCPRDEWVFTDMALLHSVLSPAVRMALKLQQDYFVSHEEYTGCSVLYSAILNHTANLVICHETSPIWRHSVLKGAPQLLALRHAMEEGTDEYKVIMLNKRLLDFRVIRLNRECVRGLWAGQQQELVFLRNRNPERGSIQNALQVLRNIINSSCDQPIGYPIYVSPLSTSYADSSLALTSLLGKAITVRTLLDSLLSLWNKIVTRCTEGCASGSRGRPAQNVINGTLQLSRSSLGTRGSVTSGGKPSTSLVSLAGLLQSTAVPPLPEPPRTSNRRQSRDRCKDTARKNKRPRTSETRTDLPSVREDKELQKASQPPRPPTPDSSLEEVRLDSTYTTDDSKMVSSKSPSACYYSTIRRDASEDVELGLRRYLQDSAAKDLAKISKELKYERESYRDLAGKYIELPADAKLPQKDANVKFSDLSTKETMIRQKDRKTECLSKENSIEIKQKLKKSDSCKSELKSCINVGCKVVLSDISGVYDCINLGRRIDVIWPSEEQKEKGGRNFWGNWIPTEGMDGVVVHKWVPNHRDPKLRSHVDKTILLVQIDNKFVPIAENCVQDLGDEV